MRYGVLSVIMLAFCCGICAGGRVAAETQADAPATVQPSGAGLQGYYFSGNNFETLSFVRVDPEINCDWNAQSAASGFPRENFSVRWLGKVQAKYSETYTFYVCCDDGQRLWVDGQQLVDDWNDHGATERSATIDLKAGQRYEIRMEYYQGGGGASAQLSWSSASQAKEIIPRQYLIPPLLEGGRLVWDDSTDLHSSAIWSMDAEGQVKKLTEAGAAQPALSRDGKRIVYVSARHVAWNDAKVPFNTELYLMNADGSGQRRISNSSYGEMTPTFSPNGQKIAFATKRDGNWQIYCANYDGSFPKRVTQNGGLDCAPAFSPDGKQLVFQSQRDGQWDIYRIDVDGSGETRLTTHGGRTPSFNADGSKILYLNTVDGKTDLYLSNADGSGTPTRVALPAGTNFPATDDLALADPARPGLPIGAYNYFVYSPYGCEIALAAKLEADTDTGIYLMGAGGNGVSRLVGPSGCVNISWAH